jgi:hypothetical protein
MVDPKLMCRVHILGEARECHALVGTILHGKRLSGTKYITTGLVEVHNIRKRHDELAQEMARRGYHHKSPLPDVELWTEGHVDSCANLVELARRCPECRKRIEARSKTHV